MPINLKKYEIFLDLNGLDYDGIERVKLSSDKVELDSVGLNILSVKADGKDVPFEVKEGKLIVHSPVNDELEIHFKGRVSKDSILGIYSAPYDEGKYMITTQFEPIYARNFIPCFDRPDMKAVFKLFVKVPKGLKVISNTRVINVKEDGGKLLYEFEETPRMSTYLLYLGIDEFEEIKDESKRPTIIVATVPGKVNKGYFALHVARRVIDFYEKYFEIPYQLEKLHLIQVPDFEAGAMENWGAVTFRETELLADDSSSVSHKLRVSSTIAHELAHQWFGNLVTLKWWNDLWLNESFATFMSYKALKDIFPQWDPEGIFLLSDTLNAMEKDSLSTTHPIEANVKEAHEIMQMFDSISYGKGASVLRMIEGFIGEEEFRRGVVNYLNRHKFSNAEGKEFWESLGNVEVEDWITKPSYPVIFVRVEGNSIEFEQKRFTLLNVDSNELYKVPLTYEVNGKFGKFLFDKRREEVKVDKEVKEIKVNVNRSGFYRVFYDKLTMLPQLNDYEELGLVNDYWSFLLASMIDFKTYQEVLSKVNKNPLVAMEITQQLNTLFLVDKRKFFHFSRGILVDLYKLYRNSKDPLGEIAYTSIASNLAYEDEDFALGLSNLFLEYDKLPSKMKNAVAIAYAVSTGDFQTLVNKYTSYILDEEKIRMLNAIGSIGDKSIINNVVQLILNRTIKLQDSPYLIFQVMRNPFVRDEACKFIEENFEQLKNFISTAYGGPWALGQLISSMTMCGVDNPDEVVNFLEKIRFKEISKPIDEVEERIKVYSRLKNLDT
ncbi:M1 family metallopeptidase [Acidianus ambivalens]|uniref:Aminopeptidase n=1 Tax=Acidianus ambivalens TaxID=2283 RepID=A0A650CU37_ACIAM|nr:M1 family metallopeptidase [Acidianus ambivalens]MQL56237.1 leucyl aminopeptidase [Acidianus ambivalens]QGR21225.1 leucyl aminopeptidase [Acidianus ambivalens]